MPVNQAGLIKPKSFGFEWTIKRFFTDCQKVGDYYTSPMFPIPYPNKDTHWYLQIFPRGDNKIGVNSVSLYLHFQSENVVKVTVDYQVSLVSKQHCLSKVKKGKTFQGPKDSWGFYKFIELKDIKDAIVDDTLTVLCDITFPHRGEDLTKKLKDYDSLLDNIGKGLDNYENLLDTNYFSDVTVEVQGTKMYLHKAILMCRNPVFKAMFENEMRENEQSVVTITDVDYLVMKELFRFIYSGRVENVEKIARDLLIAADKYSVIELKALCEITLYNNLKIDNAVEYLRLIDMCDTIHLGTLVIKFVAAHYKNVIQLPGFPDLNSNIMFQIMQAIAEKN